MSVKEPLKGGTAYVPPPDYNFVWYKADNERLREALQWIASRCPTQFVDLQPHRIHLEAAHDAGACARAALQEVPR